MLKRLGMMAGIVFAVLSSVASAQAERRVALVIGNSAYMHTSALRNPKNDATDLTATLKQVGFEVHLGLDLDQRGFALILDKFVRELDGADVGLLFYAGHALQISEKNYLVSTNARLESEFLITSEAIELEPIIRLMESKAPINLIFLDACRNNPLADQLRQNMGALKRGSNLGRGLARMETTGRDTLIAFAAAPGQEAADGAERNSPFTAALLRHMTKPGLEVSVMLKEVTADVRRETRSSQRPQQLSDMSRTFYFAAAPPSVAAPQVVEKSAASPDRTLDVAYWSSAQTANDCDSVRAYIQRFPEGVFIDLARLAERRLCAPGRRITVIAGPTAPDAAAEDTPPPAPTMAPSAPVPTRATPAPAIAAAPVAAALLEPAITARPADPPPVANLAALPEAAPASSPAPFVADGDLARNIQLELIRIGCAKGRAEDDWDRGAQDAVRKFNHYAKARFDVKAPSRDMMAALRGYDKRVCPLECGPGTRASGDVCLAIERAVTPKSRKAEPREHESKAAEPRRAPQERAAAAPKAATGKTDFHNPNCTSRIQVGGKWCCVDRWAPSLVLCP